MLLNDLRATWAGIDKRNAAVVTRFRDRVGQVAPGSGLEFEVENVLAALAAQATSKPTEPEPRVAAETVRREQPRVPEAPKPSQAGRTWFAPGVAEIA